MWVGGSLVYPDPPPGYMRLINNRDTKLSLVILTPNIWIGKHIQFEVKQLVLINNSLQI